MNKNIVWILAIVMVGIAAFFIGKGMGTSATPARVAFGGGSGQFAGRTGAAGGGATAGQIVSTGSGSVTVQTAGGSTKIVLIGETTSVMKTVAGSASDLQVGTNVMVLGSTNSDGSVTAQSVQIRPATTTRTQ